MGTRLISEDAIVASKEGRFVQIICRDLPEGHHNHFVNVFEYPDCSIGDTGKVEYVVGPRSGLLHFIKND